MINRIIMPQIVFGMSARDREVTANLRLEFTTSERSTIHHAWDLEQVAF